MAATAVQNPTVRSESKSAKKKKAKADSTASSTPAPVEPAPESANGDGAHESPYVKELHKTVRSINKRLANMAKVELIVAENPDTSLDELVHARKINADQRAQILNKPHLQANLTQLEEQIAQYKKIDQEYKAQLQSEKAELEKSITEQAKQELEAAVTAAKDEAAAQALKEQQESMLVLSKYLRLVAARRAEEDADAASDEHEALEGVLLAVYTGDDSAVTTMVKLTQGSDEKCFSVAGEQLETTYAQVKAAALAYGAAAVAETASEEGTPAEPMSDPTIANAGLTEIDDPTVQKMVNGHVEPASEGATVPENAAAGNDGANAAAEANWHPNNDLSASQEWVEVPREPAETDTGIAATPAANTNIQSWADEQPEAPAVVKAPAPASAPAPTTTSSTPPNDGFHEVRRSSGRGRGGRGDGGGYRGRGGRGDGYRGRGRGAPRGGPRPPRRADDS